AADNTPHAAQLARLAAMVRLEVVEPARALPFLSPNDYRIVDAYAQCLEVSRAAHDPFPQRPKRTWSDPFRRAFSHFTTVRSVAGSSPDTTITLDVLTATHWRRYENGKVIAEGANSLGAIPLVHIQNTAVPFEYSGASDVEPLIPLQDELNTRLSDRAHRITMQSFRMYLGKGIEGFDKLPVSPGRMWMTDNDQADIVEFGGDASSPSEDAHLSDVREAMDKSSGVSPVAAGAIKGRIGRLTSAAALRVTMQALLAKTDKKRTTYGAAIARMCELALAWLDVAGVFPTTPDERRVEISWPSPLPENELEKLQEAEAKVRLGVPGEIVLRELGY
ncbi:MAG: phage portal protein, partial [Planctomycetota bacterium]|nr:phage portal protein [Planctomycetota bacterium]